MACLIMKLGIDVKAKDLNFNFKYFIESKEHDRYFLSDPLWDETKNVFIDFCHSFFHTYNKKLHI
jgi:hypothetical protein